MNKELIYLIQTDTTVGFCSSNAKRLSTVKNRKVSQKILQTVDSFYTLKKKTRVPKKFKNRIRRAKKITFIYPNLDSFRVVEKNSDFYYFLKRFNSFYSTSANITKESFDYTFAQNIANITVCSKNIFEQKEPSKIFKISNRKIKKIR